MTPRAPVVHRKHKYVATDKSEIRQAVPGAVALASGNRNPALEAEGRVTPAPVCCYCR